MLAKDQQHVLTLTADIVRDERMAAMGPKVYLDLATVQQLNGLDDTVNLLLVSLDAQGREQVNATRAELNSTITSFPGLGLEISNDRAQAVEDGRENASMTSWERPTANTGMRTLP